MLFADSPNPTSNRIYQEPGYRLVDDDLEVLFATENCHTIAGPVALLRSRVDDARITRPRIVFRVRYGPTLVGKEHGD